MKIDQKCVVALTYILRYDDSEGDIIEEVTNENPLRFIFGLEDLLESFESQIKGLSVGDTFEFLLQPEQAYGEFDEDSIADLSKDLFVVDGEIEEGLLVEGNEIPISDENGNEMIGCVLEVGDDTVTMDFNHPLAGEILHFKGKINEVRLATKAELDRGELFDTIYN